MVYFTMVKWLNMEYSYGIWFWIGNGYLLKWFIPDVYLMKWQPVVMGYDPPLLKHVISSKLNIRTPPWKPSTSRLHGILLVNGFKKCPLSSIYIKNSKSSLNVNLVLCVFQGIFFFLFFLFSVWYLISFSLPSFFHPPDIQNSNFTSKISGGGG